MLLTFTLSNVSHFSENYKNRENIKLLKLQKNH